MTNAVYIVAGYAGTAATIAAYAWSIRNRTRRVARVLPEDVPPGDRMVRAAASTAATPAHETRRGTGSDTGSDTNSGPGSEG